MRSAISLVFVAALACSLPDEFQLNTYSTVEAARSDRLFERGWVPDVLPTGAGPIVEAHDLDSNARCSRSVFPDSTSPQVFEGLHSTGFERFAGELPPLPFSTKCPFSLEDAGSGGSAFLNARGGASDREFAVVRKGVLYFWSSSSR